MHIDINCDLGEGTDLSSCGRDAQIMSFISRCNIACSGHAGTPEIMERSIENALHANLKIGAHPSYPDRDNFGRESIAISPERLLESLCEQISQLTSIARQLETELDHIKLHGALYNDAEANIQLAENITTLFAGEYPSLKILGLANGAMETAASGQGRVFIREGFMDRQYLNESQLAPRSLPKALITDTAKCLNQATCLAKNLPFKDYYGGKLQFNVDTICLHGDSPQAPALAEQLTHYFMANGLSIDR
ncbi:5-oxoprolinase subunit PxpA [Microbulbifer sp. OS29]|uniref:5-oxoprolinase subunit PxpA n=1 Tax=Microbulbifer okhotskensis TaxID=2926617 RepID=A0A9X2J5D1_9GAMM|nr:5-oxoprolinase subunit PxpA [Microbulbifer okhotskensis]MCO1334259.1 5-oxoprolinase subunit PxpA [Microbulbifer okhotskensis]